jgi:hypothetical protein
MFGPRNARTVRIFIHRSPSGSVKIFSRLFWLLRAQETEKFLYFKPNSGIDKHYFQSSVRGGPTTATKARKKGLPDLVPIHSDEREKSDQGPLCPEGSEDCSCIAPGAIIAGGAVMVLMSFCADRREKALIQDMATAAQ